MKKHRKWFITVAILVLVGVFSYVQNNVLTITEIQVESDKIPEAFTGYRIVHLSDLHSKEFGDEQGRLVEKIKHLKPDVIFMTGDMVDADRYDEEATIKIAKQLAHTYPIYFVTGNHEAASGRYESFEKKLKEHSVNILRNEHAKLTKDGQHIYVLGIDDPLFQTGTDDEVDIMRNEIKAASEEIEQNEFRMLLSHRPEHFPTYVEENVDLVFSGHAHGGQVRLPFIGGLVAPGQGLFPEYTAGKYKQEDTSMVVSRGLGNSIIPQRVFNRPEIVLVELQ
ncbi:metallophosphoesterase [Bacillus manliponensis]|uniref:metallophosphoesterase n=1 Tax=Bacillus manliponensis TaxID=574376 RepID=UPI0035171E8F